MKKKNVKFIAGLLSCIMLFSTFSTISFASDIPDNQSEKNLADDIPYTNAVDYPAEEVIPVDKSTSDDLNEILETAIIDSLTIPDSAFVTVFDSKETVMDSIVSEEEFKINGFITENRTQYNLHEFYDFQSTSRFHIADWAYEANLITEAEKIDVFCDLIISQNFENIDCLESVVDTIQQYRSNSFVSEQLNSKISAILTRPSSIGLGNSSSTRDGESTYISSNFEVYYDSNDISSTSARLVAEYFERVKTMYLNLGFREPILEAGKTRYCVQIKAEPKAGNNYATGSCVKVNSTFSKICSSYIVLYKFESFNTAVRETIAHEYFHAIQNAYNHHGSWFKEACANWGKINICGTCAPHFQSQINSFIGSSLPMDHEDLEYGAVVFPLTIQKQYDVDGILSIYEKYSEYPAWQNITTSQIGNIITAGIQATGTSSGFGYVYRTMASYIYDTSVWYNMIFPQADYWADAPKTTKVIDTPSFYSDFNSNTTWSGSLSYLTSQRYELDLPTDFVGALNIEISFSDNKGKAQIYTIENVARHSVSYPSTSSDNTVEYLQSGVGDSVDKVILVISNLSSGYDVSFTVKVTPLPLQNNIICLAGFNYMERYQYLGAGEYAEYQVRFDTTGSKLIQTFGNKDTKMELYSSSGALLVSDDDDGYATNSLIRYYVNAGSTYKIRIYFYSSSNSGMTKLSITPAYGALADNAETLETYENIYSIKNKTGTSRKTFAEPNYTRVTTFTPPSSGNYVFEIQGDSEFDSFIYVIDPTSTNSLIEDQDYNDDDGADFHPLLTKNLSAGVPYLMIYSAFDTASFAGKEEITYIINKVN